MNIFKVKVSNITDQHIYLIMLVVVVVVGQTKWKEQQRSQQRNLINILINKVPSIKINIFNKRNQTQGKKFNKII